MTISVQEVFNYNFVVRFVLFSVTSIMFDKTKEKIKSSPAYVKVSQTGDKVAGCILAGFLTCLNVIGPVWNFLFVKKPDYQDDSESNDEISYK